MSLQWLSVWAAAPQPLPAKDLDLQREGRSFRDTTIRQTVRVNLPSKQIRLTVSNLFGSSPLTLNSTSIALADGQTGISAGSPAIVLSTLQTVTFAGSKQLDLTPSGSHVSDPIHLDLDRGDHLSISIYCADGYAGESINGHFVAHTTSWLRQGNVSKRYDVGDGMKKISWFWISRIEALVPTGCGLVGCFGDSITDTLLNTNTYAGWSDGLTRQLDARKSPLSVVNLGISGDRLLTGGIARFARDVLQPSHGSVGYLVIHIGVNDLGFTPPDSASQSDLYHRLVSGYQQACNSAHQRGFRVIGSTIMPLLSPPDWPTPWEFSDERRDHTRQKVNKWIMTSGAFDRVIDFSAAVEDPQHPNRMRPSYHNGDYLHPSPEGYAAMLRAIDLDFFTSSLQTC